ncbi:alpha-E domain-containing protein [Isosphaeraceae bacterium EP7]
MLSRVADTLYWMSRYLERAEHTARLVDVNLNLMLDQSPESAVPRWDRVLTSLRAKIPGVDLESDPYAIARTLMFDPTNPSSVVACIGVARENARQARELISSDMWEHLNRMYLDARTAGADGFFQAQPADFLRGVRLSAHTFQGLTESTIAHDESWRFIELGRYIERAGAVATLLDAYFNTLDEAEAAPGGDHLEWIGLLKGCTAFEAYCKVYTADLHPDRIAEFLLLSGDFPHSVRFAVERVQGALQAIAAQAVRRNAGRLDRLAGRLRSALSFGQIDEILVSGLHAYLEEIRRQCALIHKAIHDFYIAYSVESALGA